MPTKRPSSPGFVGLGYVPPGPARSALRREIASLETRLGESRAKARAQADRLSEQARRLEALADIERELALLHGHLGCLRAAAEILADTVIDARPLSAVRGADLDRLLGMLGVLRR
jgi:hypothetical protein